MKSICFIVCYFGKLPDYFQLWLDSCSRNETVDFIVITDDETKFRYPINVIKIVKSFYAVKEKILSIFDFDAVLDTPYKLCDYKPSYGEAFQNLISKYDYWGFCDIDLIWGDIRKFLNDDILTSHERILTRGHCSVFKNTPAVNCYYRTLTSNGCQNYKDVYKTNETRAYDEWAGHLGWGISEIFKRNGVLQYDEKIYLGPDFLKYHLYKEDENGKSSYFVEYDDGKIYAVFLKKNLVCKEEYMYFHFQKRPPKLNVDDYKTYFFVPPNIVRSNAVCINKSDFKKIVTYNGVYLEPFKFRWRQVKKLVR